MKQQKLEGTCRKGHKIILPCNWVKEGRCGDDTLPCRIVNIREVNPPTYWSEKEVVSDAV